ncbi:MAG: molybdopterin-dependent oxidoreductase [Burkholderiaceae bacterium]
MNTLGEQLVTSDGTDSRRRFLKLLGAASTSSLLYAGPGAALAQLGASPIRARDGLVFDPEVKTVMTFHDVHCHGSCILKAHVKHGRLIKLTSAGDVARGQCAADESIGQIQRRACIKGYAERKRVYSPDRLKYPLKQTIERGNLAGFRRISWDEAVDDIAARLDRVRARGQQLGYLPAWEIGQTLLPFMGTALGNYGHHSAGNLTDALNAAIGWNVKGHPPIDMLNSKLIIVWSADPQASSPHLTFLMTKARESGVPIVVIDSRYSATAAAMATGTGEVPPWIAVRPGTDGALLAAMANTIYRRRLHDEAYLRQYCFGFFPNESVLSASPAKHPVTGKAYAGTRFTVPEGQSFVEYLDDLQKDHGGEEGVLRWAALLTGVPAATIEALALAYAKAGPACIYAGWTSGGAQRTGNGMFYSWLVIALAAMTGNVTRRGGGIGTLSNNDGYAVKLGKAPALSSLKKHKPILFSRYMSTQVLMTGRDQRSAEQLRADVQLMNGIDLGADPRLEIDMIWRGGGSADEFNQRSAINPKLTAWKKPHSIISYEWFMSSTARWSDLVLPSATGFEQSQFSGSRIKADINVVNQVIRPLYECQPDWRINEMIAARIGLDFGRKGKSDEDIMRAQWAGASLPASYRKINPDLKLPSFEEMRETANFQLPTPLDQTFIHAASFAPGKFPTDTGRINFYSPFLAERKRGVDGVHRAQYVRPPEGYEDVVAQKKGAKGIAYGLQYVTPHLVQRAHSSFDNIALLKDQHPHGVELHPIDAEVRGIKDGDKVYVYNDAGCMRIPARLTRRLMPGVISIGEGAWYRPSSSETYEAWFDLDGDGKPEPHRVPVDVGGNTNSLTTDREVGAGDPVISAFTNKSGGFAAGGNLCEVSKIKPR